MRRSQTVVALAGAALALVALSGCSTLQPFLHRTFPEQFGPYRGDDGQVVAETEASVRYLELNDCFDFPDEPDESRVSLKPCSEGHAFRVIATGSVGLQQQQTLGLQAAITQACEGPFNAWAATMPADQRKDYKFLVREPEDGSQAKIYTCIAALQKLG